MDAGSTGVSRPNWFLALPLPRQADWHQASLTAPPELRRFHPADLHLTVAFLGSCGAARAEAAWLALAPRASAATTVSAASWRALGPAHQPSAYGLLLDQGRVELEQLLACWGASALEAADCADSRRPPLPHVTLLRPRRQEAAYWTQPMQQWMATAPLPSQPLRLEHLALYTWSCERRERLFRIVHQRLLDSPTWTP